MSQRSNHGLLRQALLLDFVGSVATAALLLLATERLSQLFGLPSEAILGAGSILIPWCILVGWATSFERAPNGLVWLIIALNALWVGTSGLLLVSGVVAPTPLGAAFVIVQAAAVTGFMALQFIGLGRARAIG